MALKLEDFDRMNELHGKHITVIHMEGDTTSGTVETISPIEKGDYFLTRADGSAGRISHITGRMVYFQGGDKCFVWEGSTIEVNGQPWMKKEGT